MYPPLRKSDIKRIQLARKILTQDISRHITIRELSKKAGINEYLLKYGFKKMYKRSVYNYLLMARMKAVKKLLSGSGMNIKEIAANTGYINASNLAAAFRRIYKITPSQWRKKNFSGIS